MSYFYPGAMYNYGLLWLCTVRVKEGSSMMPEITILKEIEKGQIHMQPVIRKSERHTNTLRQGFKPTSCGLRMEHLFWEYERLVGYMILLIISSC